MILISPSRATTLATVGTSNNPFVVYDNAAEDGTLTTSIGTEVRSAALAATGTTYDPWRATPSGGEAALQLVLPTAYTLQFGAIAAHNLGTIGASVRLQYSDDGGSTWDDAGAGPANPTDNQAIGFYFGNVSATHWRIYVTGAGSNEVSIGVAMFSSPVTFTQRIYQGYTPPITPTKVSILPNTTEGGHMMKSAVVMRGSSASASFSNLSESFIRGASWKAFQKHFNEAGTFFWAWRPTKYGDLFLAKSDGSVIAPTNSGPKDYMSLSLGMNFYDNP